MSHHYLEEKLFNIKLRVYLAILPINSCTDLDVSLPPSVCKNDAEDAYSG